MNGHPSFGLLALDSPRLIPLYERCVKEGIMVLVHWQLNLDEDHWQQLERVLLMFPQLTFVVAHLGVAQAKLGRLAALLNTHDNLYLDCSWGGYFSKFVREVDWEPERFKDFYSQYSQQICWGTDQVMGPGHTAHFLSWQHATEIALLERPTYRGWQKYFANRQVFGLGLDQESLDDIFYKTPKEILKRIGRE